MRNSTLAILMIASVIMVAPVTAAYAKTRAIIVNLTPFEIRVDGKKILKPTEGTWDTLGSVVTVLNDNGPDMIKIKDVGKSDCGKRRHYKIMVEGSKSEPKIEGSEICFKLRIAQVGCVYAAVRWNEKLGAYKVDLERTERKNCKSKWFEEGGRKIISETIDKGLKWQENAAQILSELAGLIK